MPNILVPCFWFISFPISFILQADAYEFKECTIPFDPYFEKSAQLREEIALAARMERMASEKMQREAVESPRGRQARETLLFNATRRTATPPPLPPPMENTWWRS